MTENKRDLPETNLQEPETGSLDGSEVAVVERTYTTADMVKMSETMSNPQIARKVGMTAEGVRQRLKKYKAENASIEQFKEDEVDILAAKRKDILDSMTREQIRATKSIRDKAVTYGILTDKARLWGGESTGNLALGIKWTDVVTRSKQLASEGREIDEVTSSGINDPDYLSRSREAARQLGPDALKEQLAWERDTRKRLGIPAEGVTE